MKKQLLLTLTWAWVLVQSASAQWTTGQSAVSVLGQPSFTSNTLNTVSNNCFFNPTGIAIDKITGKVFVADFSNHRVLRFSSLAALQMGASAEAVLGQPDFTTSAFGRTQTSMTGPTQITIDRQGRLYVADQGNGRVLRFDNAASKPNGAPADGVLGQADFVSQSTMASASIMRSPTSVAVDTLGNLYVGEATTNRVLRFDNVASKPNGAPADVVLGQLNFTNISAALSRSRFNQVFGLACDTLNTLFVCDRQNNRVLIFRNAHLKTTGADADSVLGQPNFTTNTFSTTLSGLASPSGALAIAGKLFVSSGSRVLRYDNVLSKPNGAPADTGIGLSVGQPSPNSMLSPRQLAMDSSENLFVVDVSWHRVLRYSNGLTVSGGTNAVSVLGQSDFVTAYANLVTSSSFGSSFGAVAVDTATGKVFFADASNNRVLRFSSVAAAQTGASAEAVFGQNSFNTSAFGLEANRLRFPSGLAIWNGSLFVSDNNNNRIVHFDNASAKPSGANADGVLGATDFTTTGTLSSPNGLCFDQFGNLYVASSSQNRILRFNNAVNKPNGATADFVLGSTLGSHPDRTRFNQPIGVAVGLDGALYVSDAQNSRVMRFDNILARNNGDSADAIFGRGSVIDRQFSAPRRLFIDAIGTLYVPDIYSVRVFYHAATKSDTALTNVYLGQSDINALSFSPNATTTVSAEAVSLNHKTGDLFVAEGRRMMRFNTTSPMLPPTGAQAILPSIKKGYAFGLTASVYFNTPSSSAGTLNIQPLSSPTVVGSLPTGIVNISPDRYWRITATGLSGYTVTLNFSLQGMSGIQNPTALKVLYRPNASSPWIDVETLSGVTVLRGESHITVKGITSFSDFAIGSDASNQLPVELTEFGFRKVGSGIELHWRTATELNNSGFEVQRRSENRGASTEWQVLGFVRGRGTTTEAQSYSFLDRSASGKVQYRLKQIDFDGQFEYSNIIEVDAGAPKQFALEQNYPNPFNPTTTISYQLPVASQVSLKVYDVLGREVMTLVNGRQDAGAYNFNFNASELSSGVYFYRLQTGSFVAIKKMLLVK
jgi:sugar lactone lactonase YvrE